MNFDKKKIVSDKILFEGFESLSNIELFSIVFGKGDFSEESILRSSLIVSELSRNKAIPESGIEQLLSDKNLTKKERNLINALFEIAKRLEVTKHEKIEIAKDRRDVFAIFSPTISMAPHEEVWILSTNLSGRVLDKFMVSKGGTASSLVDLKIVMKRVLNLFADCVILVHNHPSDDLLPSMEDIELTDRLKNALSFFDITLTDHVIIGKSDSYSLRENGYL